MTDEEKFKAIVARASLGGWADDPMIISVMVIVYYLDQLKTLGIIDSVFKLTDTGKRVASICEEFDWKPSDDDITKFVNEMVDEEFRPSMERMIRRYRDDKNSLIEDVNKMQVILDNPKPKKKSRKKNS